MRSCARYISQLYGCLLGLAYAALVVCYVFGLQASLRGEYPGDVVWVGIVSNGGAFLYLLFNAVSGTWESWGNYAQEMMWVSLVGTGVISFGLITFGVIGARSRPVPHSDKVSPSNRSP